MTFNYKNAISEYVQEVENIEKQKAALKQLQLQEEKNRIAGLGEIGYHEIVFPSAIFVNLQRILADFPAREATFYLLGRESGNGVYSIEDIYFPHQYSTATTTESSDKAVHMKERISVLEEAGKQGLTYLAWGHSHHSMGVTPSPQDVKQLKLNAKDNFLLTEKPAIRIIINNRFDMECTQMVDDVEVPIKVVTVKDYGMTCPIFNETYKVEKNFKTLNEIKDYTTAYSKQAYNYSQVKTATYKAAQATTKNENDYADYYDPYFDVNEEEFKADKKKTKYNRRTGRRNYD